MRRNELYRADFQNCRPIAQHSSLHESGARIYQVPAHETASQNWGVLQLADPDKSALELDLFWRPEWITHVARCQARPAFDGATETFALHKFKARCGVLLANGQELVAVRGRNSFACLEIVEGSILHGESALTFFHDGFGSVSHHHETLRIFKQMMNPPRVATLDANRSTSKYLHYLIALDGHLAGRSYREIAQILYGKDSVGAYWTDDTRGLKSKVRRAVGQGWALMNGGYRALL